MLTKWNGEGEAYLEGRASEAEEESESLFRPVGVLVDDVTHGVFGTSAVNHLLSDVVRVENHRVGHFAEQLALGQLSHGFAQLKPNTAN